MSKIKIKQIRSKIGCTQSQRGSLEALGLRGIGKEKIQNSTPVILGMIEKVKHLVSVSEVKA